MNDTTKIVIALISSITVLTVAGICSVAYTSHLRNQLMAKDIQAAIDKGVNPLVVRCAYADDRDTICLVHATAKTTVDKIEMKTK